MAKQSTIQACGREVKALRGKLAELGERIAAAEEAAGITDQRPAQFVRVPVRLDPMVEQSGPVRMYHVVEAPRVETPARDPLAELRERRSEAMGRAWLDGSTDAAALDAEIAKAEAEAAAALRQKESAAAAVEILKRDRAALLEQLAAAEKRMGEAIAERAEEEALAAEREYLEVAEAMKQALAKLGGARRVRFAALGRSADDAWLHTLLPARLTIKSEIGKWVEDVEIRDLLRDRIAGAAGRFRAELEAQGAVL